MRSQRTTGVALFAAIALLSACGDDGNDRLVALDEPAEISIVSGGEADDGEMAAAVDDHDDEMAAADDHDGEMAAADDHDGDMPAAVDDHDGEMAAAVDDHDGEMAAAVDDHDGDMPAAVDDHDGEIAAAADDHDGDVESAAATGMVVNIEMVEFGFVPDTASLPVGEPVTFRFENTGVVPHEAMFGSQHEQVEFAEAGDHGDSHGSGGHHGDVAAITLEAAETAEIVLEFSAPGEVWIGCHLPGHYDAGMSTMMTVG